MWDDNGGEIYSDDGKVIQWNSAYGYLWGQGNDSCLTWGKDGVVLFRDSNGSLGTSGQVLTRKATGDGVEWASPSTKAIQASGLHLGEFQYRRNSDGFGTGTIKSNATTSPSAITRIDISVQNTHGVVFGKDFYNSYIVPGMRLHFRDKNQGYYSGKITAVDSDALTNGMRLTLEPDNLAIDGSVYLNSLYDVFIGYSKYGAFPYA